MKKILKFSIVIVYAFLVLYLSNKFIEIRHLSKNVYYFIIVFPILFIGVFGILTLFGDKNNSNGTV